MSDSLEARLRALHLKTYDTEADEAHQTNPRCDECNKSYPCPTLALLSDPSPASVGAEGRYQPCVGGGSTCALMPDHDNWPEPAPAPAAPEHSFDGTGWCSVHESAECLAAPVSDVEVALATELRERIMDYGNHLSSMQGLDGARVVLDLGYVSPTQAAKDRADAWREGYLRGTLDEISDLEPSDNPYKEEE